MAYLCNEPAEFARQAKEGMVACYPELVRVVPGGIARRTATPPGQVAVVIGGGSGHYPAFGGLVGDGLAHGAAMGNVFASPSAREAYDAAHAAQNGGGVLFSYGNYAGDVLNFSQAQERLRADGIDCRTAVVTDDIASGSVDEIDKRRGIAGDLAVFKIAAAAANEGQNLDQVAEVAGRTNDRTRSLGIAFSGCTLPGASDPLFTVPEGKIGIGVGIHGEPGIDETDVGTASELAEMLWQRVLAEKPADAGDRAVVLVNGLGSVKQEELLVFSSSVLDLARRDGLTVADIEVGELVTSFEMAGVSLTITWADADMERLWAAPAYTPAFRKQVVDRDPADRLPDDRSTGATQVPEASRQSQQVAATIVELFRAAAATIDEHAEELGRMDSVAGDGDHGIGMQRGVQAAVAAAADLHNRGAGARSLLVGAGDAWANAAGGTSGALWGGMVNTLGRFVDDQQVPDAQQVNDAVTRARRSVIETGGAEPGDKTMVDALVAFSDTLDSEIGAGHDLGAACVAAASAATTAADETADLTARVGRARPHAEASRGTPDPGAVSLALIATAVGSSARNG